MVSGLPQLKESSKICTDYMVGKQHRDVFSNRGLWRVTQSLQLVHGDICGPIKPFPNSKKRYFIRFIYNYSRIVWIYFLTLKPLLSSRITKILLRKRREILFVIYAQIGVESSIFFAKLMVSVDKLPQQNGVVEHKNRTIMIMVRSILSEKQVPKNFWPEAVNWTVHVLNRSSTVVVKDMTPKEPLSGVKPKVDYFQVFGCIGHVHVSVRERS